MSPVCKTPPCALAHGDMLWCSATCMEAFMRAVQAPINPDDTHDPRHGSECRHHGPARVPGPEPKPVGPEALSWLGEAS